VIVVAPLAVLTAALIAWRARRWDRRPEVLAHVAQCEACQRMRGISRHD
jgi:hypothetical protein